MKAETIVWGTLTPHVTHLNILKLLFVLFYYRSSCICRSAAQRSSEGWIKSSKPSLSQSWQTGAFWETSWRTYRSTPPLLARYDTSKPKKTRCVHPHGAGQHRLLINIYTLRIEHVSLDCPVYVLIWSLCLGRYEIMLILFSLFYCAKIWKSFILEGKHMSLYYPTSVL